MIRPPPQTKRTEPLFTYTTLFRAISEDGVVLAISLLDLVEALRDQEGAHAVAGQERKAGFEEIQPAERRELVEHHEQLMPGSGIGAVLRMEMLGQPAADLVEH